MKIFLSLRTDDDLLEEGIEPGWHTRWNNEDHNHIPSDAASAHAIHRTLTPEIKAIINGEYIGNSTPMQVYDSLTSQFGMRLALKPRDVHNEFARLRAERLNGKTPLEALLVWLEGNDESSE